MEQTTFSEFHLNTYNLTIRQSNKNKKGRPDKIPTVIRELEMIPISKLFNEKTVFMEFFLLPITATAKIIDSWIIGVALCDTRGLIVLRCQLYNPPLNQPRDVTHVHVTPYSQGMSRQ